MKKIILVTALAVLFSSAALAQNYNVKPFEFEIGAGMTMGGKAGLTKVVPGPNAYLEARVNLFDSPWDVAVQTSFGGAFRKQDDKLYTSGNKFGITAFADYNFRRWDRVAPFIGLGVGRTAVVSTMPSIGADGTVVSSKTTYPAFILNPRVGVEVFDHLRMSAEYKFTFHKESSYFALNLGFAFGGGKR